MKIIKRLQNMWRQKVDDADRAMADTSRDGKYAIEDAKKEVRDFTEKIANLKRQVNIMAKRLDTAESDSEKMQKIAERALLKGAENDARKALEEKARIDKQIAQLRKQITTNNNLYHQFLDDRAIQQDKIADAETNLASLAARKEAAEMREEAARARAGFKSSSALSALDALRDEVDSAEAEAEAFEDIALEDNSADALEDKYDDTTCDVDIALANLKAKMLSTATGNGDKI